MLFKPTVSYINLFESREVNRWMKKWGVDASQFSNAIIETGTTNVQELEKYLRSKGFCAMPVKRLFRALFNIH